MPCRYGSTASHRVLVELVEADFEIGFNLVDLAESDPADAPRILADAESVLEDIVARAGQLDAGESDAFGPLVGELRRAIDLALLRRSGASGK